VFFFHHVESLGRIVEDAVEHVHHARALSSGLRPEFAEKPVQSLGLSKLGTVGVVATNDGSWNKKTDFNFTFFGKNFRKRFYPKFIFSKFIFSKFIFSKFIF
jgi:hypothetical protein